jgi:hypothetical protein
VTRQLLFSLLSVLCFICFQLCFCVSAVINYLPAASLLCSYLRLAMLVLATCYARTCDLLCSYLRLAMLVLATCYARTKIEITNENRRSFAGLPQ